MFSQKHAAVGRNFDTCNLAHKHILTKLSLIWDVIEDYINVESYIKSFLPVHLSLSCLIKKEKYIGERNKIKTEVPEKQIVSSC